MLRVVMAIVVVANGGGVAVGLRYQSYIFATQFLNLSAFVCVCISFIPRGISLYSIFCLLLSYLYNFCKIALYSRSLALRSGSFWSHWFDICISLVVQFISILRKIMSQQDLEQVQLSLETKLWECLESHIDGTKCVWSSCLL